MIIKKIFKVAESYHHNLYLAKNNSDLFIIKELKDILNIDRKTQLRKEGQWLKDIYHKNIVKCFEVNNKNIVLEFLKGETLYYNLKTKDISLKESINIVYDLLKTVNHLHENNIVHNDLNPMNIIYYKNQVKVIDLSVAQPMNSDVFKLGSPEFSSPEQLKQEKVNRMSDFWAIGCIFYYLVMGYRPFKYNPIKHEQLYKEIDKKALNHKLNNELSNLIIAMLNKDWKDRPSYEETLLTIRKFKQ